MLTKCGARRSRRAADASARGLLTAAEVARRCGTVRVRGRRRRVTAAAVDRLGVETEWHHSGWNWKETNYYDPDDLPVIRHYARYMQIVLTLGQYYRGAQQGAANAPCGREYITCPESGEYRQCRGRGCYYYWMQMEYRADCLIEEIAASAQLAI